MSTTLNTIAFQGRRCLVTGAPGFKGSYLSATLVELGAHVVEQEGCVDYMPHENPVQGLSCAMTRSQLGWAPERGFEESLAELVEYYRPGTSRQSREIILAEAVATAASRLNEHDATLAAPAVVVAG
jgi:hypothetical protein